MQFVTFNQIFSIGLLLGFLGALPQTPRALPLYGPTSDGTVFCPLRKKVPSYTSVLATGKHYQYTNRLWRIAGNVVFLSNASQADGRTDGRTKSDQRLS